MQELAKKVLEMHPLKPIKEEIWRASEEENAGTIIQLGDKTGTTFTIKGLIEPDDAISILTQMGYRCVGIGEARCRIYIFTVKEAPIGV